ncbi:MAG: hypothetical protein GJ676_07845 [Rhodobacteraceae bacterium]|nr:hypothetical protein [Paracoccaceae bacterium]
MDRRILFLTCLVLALTAFLVIKDLVLSTGRHDLFFHKKFVDADELWDPAPGKLYAIHKRSGRFEEGEICKAAAHSGLSLTEVRYVTKNLIGMKYNDALASLPEFVSEKAPKILRALNAETTWLFYAEHNAPASSQFDQECQRTVTRKFWDEAYYVYQVETVYFASPEKTDPFMVRFKSSPMLVEECDPACRETMPILEHLREPRFLIWLRRNVVDVDRIFHSTSLQGT